MKPQKLPSQDDVSIMQRGGAGNYLFLANENKKSSERHKAGCQKMSLSKGNGRCLVQGI